MELIGGEGRKGERERGMEGRRGRDRERERERKGKREKKKRKEYVLGEDVSFLK